MGSSEGHTACCGDILHAVACCVHLSRCAVAATDRSHSHTWPCPAPPRRADVERHARRLAWCAAAGPLLGELCHHPAGGLHDKQRYWHRPQCARCPCPPQLPPGARDAAYGGAAPRCRRAARPPQRATGPGDDGGASPRRRPAARPPQWATGPGDDGGAAPRRRPAARPPQRARGPGDDGGAAPRCTCCWAAPISEKRCI